MSSKFKKFIWINQYSEKHNAQENVQQKLKEIEKPDENPKNHQTKFY